MAFARLGDYINNTNIEEIETSRLDKDDKNMLFEIIVTICATVLELLLNKLF